MYFDSTNSSVLRGSGTYRIQAKGGSLTDWTDVTGDIQGDITGTIITNLNNNPQQLNNSLLVPGVQYEFRMIDVIIALVSNSVTLTIPEYLFTLDVPDIDYQNNVVNLTFSFTGLNPSGSFRFVVSVDGGLTWQEDPSEQMPLTSPLQFPIDNYGSGIANGSYMVKMVSNEFPNVVSNTVAFTINALYGQALVLVNVNPSAEPNDTGTPVDLAINFNTLPGYDGTNPIEWEGNETFALQYFDGTDWVTIGDTFTQASPTIENVQLPNANYDFRIVCAENSIVSQEINTGIYFGHSDAILGFSINIGEENGGNDGLMYKVTVDGVPYTVNGDASMTGRSDMQIAMKALLDANTQGFTVDLFVENGDPNNYAFTLKAPANSNGTWNGKVVRVECGNTETVYQGGNITINGVVSPALGGTLNFPGSAPGEGVFQYGY